MATYTAAKFQLGCRISESSDISSGAAEFLRHQTFNQGIIIIIIIIIIFIQGAHSPWRFSVGPWNAEFLRHQIVNQGVQNFYNIRRLIRGCRISASSDSQSGAAEFLQHQTFQLGLQKKSWLFRTCFISCRTK